MTQQEIELPWQVDSVVSPKAGEKFDPFKVTHLIYPTKDEWDILVWNATNRRPSRTGQLPLSEQFDEQPEDTINLDFIRVVVDDKGNVHWRYGHNIRTEGKLVWDLRHHGGRSGVSSVDIPINQADRIFDRILGFVKDEKSSQTVELLPTPEDDGEDTIFVPRLTFSAALVGLRASSYAVQIPGEQARIRQYLSLVEDVVRGQTIPTTTPRLEVMINRRLDALRRQLAHKQAPSLQIARENLELFLNEKDSPNALEILVEVQHDFFDRLRSLSDITLRIAARQIAMRKFRVNQENLLSDLYSSITDLLGGWDNQNWTEERLIEMVRKLINSRQTVGLSEVVVQPFKDRAERVGRLLKLEDALTAGNFERVSRSLQEASLELHAAERHISARRHGAS